MNHTYECEDCDFVTKSRDVADDHERKAANDSADHEVTKR